MRYHLTYETETHIEARRLFACGLCAFVAAFLWESASEHLKDLSFLFDLFGCVLFFCGALLWDRKRMRLCALLFAAAFCARLVVLIVHPKGLFSFLYLLPFALLSLIGELIALKALIGFYRKDPKNGYFKRVRRIYYALPRAEVCFWIATTISYISDLLLLPAALLFLWTLGLRLWISFLLFSGPHAGAFLRDRNKSPQSQ